MNTNFLHVASMTLVPILCCIVSISAWGHHILGTPHYAYSEDYPQTPTLTYGAELGAYRVNMTCFPGRPSPGDRTSLHFYIRQLESGEPYSGKVTLTVFRDELIGDDPVVYGPVEGDLEEAMYKFFPQFSEEANYTIRLHYFADGSPWILDLPIVVGEPGSPLAVGGGVAVGLLIFVIIVRAVRIKRTRLVQQDQRNPVGSAVT